MPYLSIVPSRVARRLVLGLAALAAGSVQAEVSVWTGDAAASGNTVGDWYTTSPGNWSGDVAPSFTNTNDIKIAGTQDLDQYIRQHVTIRSLEFTSSNVGATQIGLKAGNGDDRDLTFSADSGNSTLTVDAAASGDKTLGTQGGIVTLGEVVLTSDLDIIHNGSGDLIFAAEIRGGGDLSISGSGLTVFSGTNTYSGNTSVDGALTLSDGAQLTFTLGTNGVNNALSGSGTVTINGSFLFDLTLASTTLADSWQVIDVSSLTEAFGGSFGVSSTNGSFIEIVAGVWAITENGISYEFSENTGLMTVVNFAPVFTVDPIVKSDATEALAYSDTLNGSATDAESDPLTYAKLAGPGWLAVATDGTLSGSPSYYDDGLNSFQVGASDNHGNTTIATLEINVIDAGNGPGTPVVLADLRGLIGTTPTINGANISDPNVSITKAGDGNDVVYSLSLINQNFDGGASATDSLSWDIRVKGFTGGSTTLNGNDSSVTLGSSAAVGTVNNEFGVSGTDSRFIDMGESVQFSVENVALTADAGFAAIFDGFDGIWMTTGTYILGEGSGGLESQVVSSNADESMGSRKTLTITSAIANERVRDLGASFTVAIVGGGNNAPAFSNDPINELGAVEGQAYSSSIADNASDLESDVMTFSKVSGPAWLSVASDGTLSGTPGAGDVGANVFSVQVSATGGSDTAMLNISVTENQAPAFSSDPINEIGAEVGQAYSSSIAGNALDPESDAMTFSKVSGPAWLSVASNGALSGVPSVGDVGANVFSVQVSATGGSDTATLNISVTENQAPAFSSDPLNKAAGTENAAYSGSIAGDASDLESDAMTFSKVSGPAWLSVASDGSLSGNPGAGDVGSNAFSVQVSATGGSDTATLNITIYPVSSTYIWNGSVNGDWAADANWEGEFGQAVDPDFANNTTVIQIAGTNNLDQFIRVHSTIKSLEFVSSNTNDYALGLRAGNGADRDLKFSADIGNATLTVDALASGDKTFGANLLGTLTDGEVVLLSDLDVTHNGSGNLIFASEIRGAGNITKTGTGTVTLSGINTYTGNTTVDDGTLTLSDDAQLAFTIGTNGVNTALSGSGTVVLDGDFRLDLAGAGRTPGDSWQLVDVNTLTETFGMTFSLASEVGSFTETNGVWSITENGVEFEFAENTGLLTVVSALPVAHWMSGAYGVGWIFRAEQAAEIANWNIDTLVAQVQTIPNVTYVNFNLSDAAGGSQFLAPHSVLSVLDLQLPAPVFIPNGRDLFLEALTKFKAAGYKVVVYYSGQGPALLKHGVENAVDKVDDGNGGYTSESMDVWINYVHTQYNVANFADEREMLKTAHAEIIFAEYAERYGALVDGWWFDQNVDSNTPLQYAIAKEHNPNVVVHQGSEPSTENDTLSGHPVPLQQYPTSDQINLPQLTNIELSDGGYRYTGNHPSLGNMYMAMGTAWYAGNIVWQVDQAADWIERTLNAGGTWCWSFDCTDADSILRADMVSLALDVHNQMVMNQSNFDPVFKSDALGGGMAEVNMAYSGSLVNEATDHDGDTLNFVKVSGPDWLVVSANGTLSGTPVDDLLDVGMNRFTVLVEDGFGGSDFAELEIFVNNSLGGNTKATAQLSFDDLRGNLSTGTINGQDATDPDVTITKVTNGNDIVLSLSIINQDFDGEGNLDDSLSWDVRVKGFSGGTVVLNGNDSSVTLGSSVPVGAVDNEFGVSGTDLRFIDDAESIQFSVENVSLSAAPNMTVKFDGFDGLWGTTGSYIFGVGTSGLESQSTMANGELTLASDEVLTVTSVGNIERIRHLDGGFTISPNNAPYFLASLIQANHEVGVAYSDTLTNLVATATDPDGDLLTYSKADGPAWLSVAPNGTLSGTPGGADVGLNSFTLQVEDPLNATDTLIFKVIVDGGDTDGDGYSDWMEDVMGTDPADTSSRMTVNAQTTGTGFDLSWSTVSGRTYHVERSVDLKVWESYLENVSYVPGEDVSVDITINVSSPDKVFYRIQIEP